MVGALRLVDTLDRPRLWLIACRARHRRPARAALLRAPARAVDPVPRHRGRLWSPSSSGAARGTSAAPDHHHPLLKDRAATLAAPIALVVLVALLSLATTACSSTGALLSPVAAWRGVRGAVSDVARSRATIAPCSAATPVWVIVLRGRRSLGAALLASERDQRQQVLAPRDVSRAVDPRVPRRLRARAGDPNPFTGFDPLDNVSDAPASRRGLRHRQLPEPAGVHRPFEARAAPADPASAALFGRLSVGNAAHDREPRRRDRASSTLDRDRLLDDLNLVVDTAALERDPRLPAVRARAAPPARRGRAPGRAGTARCWMPRIPTRSRRSPPPHNAMHVVNMALNLVGGPATSPGRSARPSRFTVDPAALRQLPARLPALPGLRRRARRHLAGHGGGHLRRGGQPEHGLHSSPAAHASCMTLFNARLGVVARQPRPAGQTTSTRAAARAQLGPGAPVGGVRADRRRHPYVYLSDGGHFENLGLYEMVLRRCRACRGLRRRGRSRLRVRRSGQRHPQDPHRPRHPHRLRATGSCIRPSPSQPEDGARYCALGTIRYSAVDGRGAEDGTLIYLKPAVCGAPGARTTSATTPARSADFPHEPTADQCFSESQFESYRKLGVHIVDKVVTDVLQPW